MILWVKVVCHFRAFLLPHSLSPALWLGVLTGHCIAPSLLYPLRDPPQQSHPQYLTANSSKQRSPSPGCPMDNKSYYWQRLFPLTSHVLVPWGSSSDSHCSGTQKGDSSVMLTSDLTRELRQFNNPLQSWVGTIKWSLHVWLPVIFSTKRFQQSLIPHP